MATFPCHNAHHSTISFSSFFFRQASSSPTVIIHFYPLLFIRFYKVYIENRHKTSTFHSSVNNRDFSKRHRDSSKNSREMDFFAAPALVPSSSLAPPTRDSPTISVSLSRFQSRRFLSFQMGKEGGRGGNSVAFF